MKNKKSQFFEKIKPQKHCPRTWFNAVVDFFKTRINQAVINSSVPTMHKNGGKMLGFHSKS